MKRRDAGFVRIWATVGFILLVGWLLAADSMLGQGLPPTSVPRGTPTPRSITEEFRLSLASLLPAGAAPRGAASVGGGNFTLRAGAPVHTSWVDGTQETGYLVIRWSPTSRFAFLPAPDQLLAANTSSYDDAGPLPDPTYCYVLLPLGGNPPSFAQVLAISDLLCVYPGTQQGASPGSFAVHLDQSTVAKLSWTAPGGQGSYELLARRFDGSADRIIPLSPGRTTFQEDTGGLTTCYQLRALSTGTSGDGTPTSTPTTLGQTMLVCAAPGVTSFPAPTSTPTRTPTLTPAATPGPTVGAVLLASYPHVDRRIEVLANNQTRVTYLVQNNVGRPLDRFLLTFTAQAEVGSVAPQSVQTDQPGLFDATSAAGPDTTTCTLALRAGQVFAANAVARLICVYTEGSDTATALSETIRPQPILTDQNYNQISDDLEAEAAARQAVGDLDPIPVFVSLRRQPTALDLERFTLAGGTVGGTFEGDGFVSFSGVLPATGVTPYAMSAAPDLALLDLDTPIEFDLDVAVQRSRARNVWTGATDGTDTPYRNLAFRNPDVELLIRGEAQTSVAVIDSGIDGSHAAFAGKIRASRNCTVNGCPGTTANDTGEHGSHVAGIVGAHENPGGPPGVAPDVGLINLRVGGNTSHAISAIRWARANREAFGIVALNYSASSNLVNWTLIQEVEEAVDDGIIFVTSAGNHFDQHDPKDRTTITSPGLAPSAITVGATTDANEIAGYSSHGPPSTLALPKPDVVAPGGEMASLIRLIPLALIEISANGHRVAKGVDTREDRPPNTGINSVATSFGGLLLNQYIEKVGTSMATPHVAGLAALLIDAMSEYGAENGDGDGPKDEDPWDGVDNDGDDIIDEDVSRWLWLGTGPRNRAARAAAARLVKSIILMTAYELTGGQTIPEWAIHRGGNGRYPEVIDDLNHNGRRDPGEVLSVYMRSAAGDLIWDRNNDGTYQMGPGGDVVIPPSPLPAGWAPSTLNGAALQPAENPDGTTGYVPVYVNHGAVNAPPPVSRGGKDNVEGYGMVAADAAVEAVTREFCAWESDRFGFGFNDKKVWARHVHLYSGKEYQAILDVPAGADYDLYVYFGTVRPPGATNPDGALNWLFGEPIILAKSTSAALGGREQVTFTPPRDGTYFLVAKRVSGDGQFTVRLVTPEEWTIMVYVPAELAAGTSLDDLAFAAINRMEATGSGEERMRHFQVVVQVDYDTRSYDARDDSPPLYHQGHTVRYCIRKDHDTTKNRYSVVRPIGDPGLEAEREEVNMGDPATLQQFVEWGVNYFPAQKYALILWGDGRGYGWKVHPDGALGPGNDTRATLVATDTGNDALTMPELRTAMQNVQMKIGTGSVYKGNTGLAKKLDILGFDMGHMALVDVAHQVQPYVEVLVASEDRIHPDGWPYGPILAGLRNTVSQQPAKAWDAEDFAKHIVAEYTRYYGVDANFRDPKFTISAVRLNPRPPRPDQPAAPEPGECGTFVLLVTCLSQFAGDLRDGIEDYRTEDVPEDNVQVLIKQARELTEEMDDHNYLDLREFARWVPFVGVPLPYSRRAQPIVDALTVGRQIVLAEAHGPNHPTSGNMGLSGYYPRREVVPGQGIGSTGPAVPADRCKPAPDRGDRTCGFDNPFPAREVYAKDPLIRAPILLRPTTDTTHPRAQTVGLRFPEDTLWDEFLHRYYKPVADACIRHEGQCVKEVTVSVGTQLTFSGLGSSDADPRDGSYTPPGHLNPLLDHFIWDHAPTVDNPAPIPVYVLPPAHVDGPSCTEDCDRNGVDDPDDDPDKIGRFVTWACPTVGTFRHRLIVWDDHHDEPSLNGEEAHFEHWNVDDDWITVNCVSKTLATPTPPGIVLTPTPTSGLVLTPTPTSGIVLTPTPTTGLVLTPTPTTGLVLTPTPTSGTTGLFQGIRLDVYDTNENHSTLFEVRFDNATLDELRGTYTYDWVFTVVPVVDPDDCREFVPTFRVGGTDRGRAQWEHNPCAHFPFPLERVKVTISKAGQSVVIWGHSISPMGLPPTLIFRPGDIVEPPGGFPPGLNSTG